VAARYHQVRQIAGLCNGTLVAFPGEVNDKESGRDPFSDTSKELNPNLKGRDIRDAFAGSPSSIPPDTPHRCSADPLAAFLEIMSRCVGSRITRTATCNLQPLAGAMIKSVEDVGVTQTPNAKYVHTWLVALGRQGGATVWALYGEVQ
jgi:hypothetical protein